jgi:quercetin dioxygenase-like cupin family protein
LRLTCPPTRRAWCQSPGRARPGIQALTGRMTIQVAGVAHNYSAGETVVLDPGQEHELTALDDSVLQPLITPHPQYHSLDHELNLPPGQVAP